MAELNELIEYLYEESATAKQHGLEEIIVNLKSNTNFNPQSLLYLERILVRLHSECSKCENIMPLVLAALNLLAYRAHTLDGSSQLHVFPVDADFLSTLDIESQSTSNRCFHLRSIWAILHKSVQILRSLIPASLRMISSEESFSPGRAISLRLVSYLACVDDCHADLYHGDVVACLQSRLAAKDDAPLCLIALYNLSFKIEFLSAFSWELYWDNLVDPCSARILVHGIYSGFYTISADTLPTKATVLLKNIIDGKGPSEDTRLLYRLLVSRSDFDGIHFISKNRLLLFELLHTGIPQDNEELLRVLLFAPCGWVKDRVSIVLELVSKQPFLKEGAIYVIITLVWKHIPLDTCLKTFPVISTWSRHQYAAEAFKDENGLMIERFFLACGILNLNDFFQKVIFQIQRFKNKDLQRIIANELLENPETLSLTDEELETLLSMASRISRRVSAKISGKSNPRLTELIRNLER